MSRVLAWLGAVALVFGLGTGAVSDPGASFARVNVGFGALALGAAALLAARRLGSVAGPLARRGLWPAAARVGLVTQEEADGLIEAYLGLRAERHRSALDLPDDRRAEQVLSGSRALVRASWDRLLGGAAGDEG